MVWAQLGLDGCWQTDLWYAFGHGEPRKELFIKENLDCSLVANPSHGFLDKHGHFLVDGWNWNSMGLCDFVPGSTSCYDFWCEALDLPELGNESNSSTLKTVQFVNHQFITCRTLNCYQLNVGIAIKINHPPVITNIDSWYKPFPNGWFIIVTPTLPF